MKTQLLTFPHEAMETLKHLEIACAEGGRIEVGTVQFLTGQRSPAAGTTAHHQTEISLVMTGLLEVTAGGVKHTVREGTLLEIPPGEEHFTNVIEDSKVLYLLIDG